MEIQLTNGKVVLIDDSDFAIVSKYNSWWEYTQSRRKTSYAVSSKQINNVGKDIRMHRLILGVTDPNVFVDHIDGNGLNNQRSNLRICTRNQNQQNRPKNKNNKSGYKGVYWNTERGKWQANIMVDKKKVYLGRYEDVELAAKAYKEACIKYHKEFANH